jgi:uncharacterized protein (DUF2252 family)
MTASASSIIEAFNANREPQRRAMKMEIMRANAFSFLRGTAHLFWQRMQETNIPTNAPHAWCSGDLHLENFGTYVGDNGLVYFDLNDFDEGALAPCDWEFLRFLTSILVAAPVLGLAKTEVKEIAKSAAETYCAELNGGKSRWVERRTAKGAIDDLMSGLKKRTPARHLDSRTIAKKNVRKLDLSSTRVLPVTEQQRASIETFTKAFGKSRSAEAFFRPLDCARRIAGTGSLGVQRYVVLVEGDGSPDGNVLLDLKAANPSTLAPATGIKQHSWANDASRVVSIQHRCQAISPDLLTAVTLDGAPYLLKQLQPSADRLDLTKIAANHKALADVTATMSKLAAWAQLRSTGRDGSATKDALIAYASDVKGVAEQLVATARDMAETTDVDYKNFVTAHPPLAKAGKKARESMGQKRKST